MLKSAQNNSHVSTVPLQNERGVALILVLVMLLLLTIMGATLMTSATTDLQIAGNYRNSQEVFYVSDAAMEYVKTGNLPGGQNLYDKVGIGAGLQQTYSSTITIGTRTARYSVEYVGCGPPPLGKGYGDDTQTNFYTIETSGVGTDNTMAETESGIARVVHKTSDYECGP